MDASDGISDKDRWRFRINSSWWRILGTVCIVSVLVNLALLGQNHNQRLDPMLISPTNVNGASWISPSPQRVEKFEKPKEFRIVGLIFAGRRDRLSILDCYLRVCGYLPLLCLASTHSNSIKCPLEKSCPEWWLSRRSRLPPTNFYCRRRVLPPQPCVTDARLHPLHQQRNTLARLQP